MDRPLSRPRRSNRQQLWNGKQGPNTFAINSSEDVLCSSQISSLKQRCPIHLWHRMEATQKKRVQRGGIARSCDRMTTLQRLDTFYFFTSSSSLFLFVFPTSPPLPPHTPSCCFGLNLALLFLLSPLQTKTRISLTLTFALSLSLLCLCVFLSLFLHTPHSPGTKRTKRKPRKQKRGSSSSSSSSRQLHTFFQYFDLPPPPLFFSLHWTNKHDNTTRHYPTQQTAKLRPRPSYKHEALIGDQRFYISFASSHQVMTRADILWQQQLALGSSYLNTLTPSQYIRNGKELCTSIQLPIPQHSLSRSFSLQSTRMPQWAGAGETEK